MVVKQRKIIIPAGLVLLLVLGAVIYFGVAAWNAKNAPKDDGAVFRRVCSEEIIKRASQEIQENKLEALKKTSAEIVKIDGYNKDQNCLFILARHGLLRNDAKTTRSYLEPLKKVYIPGDYSKAFATPLLTPAEIESAVKFLDSRNELIEEQIKSNSENRQSLDAAADEAAR